MPKTLTNIRSLARGHTESALRALAAIMTNEDAAPAARIAAANSLLDRGWGKVAQPGDDDDAPLKLKLTHIVRTIVDPDTPDGTDVPPAA